MQRTRERACDPPYLRKAPVEMVNTSPGVEHVVTHVASVIRALGSQGLAVS